MGRILLNSTKKLEVVLDPFRRLGIHANSSGATRENIIQWKLELDPKFVEVIIDRYEKFTGKQRQKKVRKGAMG